MEEVRRRRWAVSRAAARPAAFGVHWGRVLRGSALPCRVSPEGERASLGGFEIFVVPAARLAARVLTGATERAVSLRHCLGERERKSVVDGGR